MKTKTLGTIQTLMKIGKVLSTIVFIFSIIGLVGCALGAVSVLFFPESIQLGSTTIQGLVEIESDISSEEVVVALITGAVVCLGEMIVSKLAQRYFKRELDDGTPFTFDGAKALLHVGIWAVVIPIVIDVLLGVAHEVLSHVIEGLGELTIGDSASISLGVMMIVASLLCKHGAELRQGSRQV